MESSQARAAGRAVVPLVAALALAACSGGAPARPVTAAATTRTSDPAGVCAGQLRHWATVLFQAGHDPGLDYQEMALSGTQYLAVLDIAAAAKRLGRTSGRVAALAFIDREARRRCAAMATTSCTTTGGGAWPC
jgi:hypothetical protein